MPVYILHGFRWPRDGFTGIRVHIIVHNLEDAAAEYIQTPDSQRLLLESFHKAHPETMAALPNGLTFIEQYNPEDILSENAVSQPFAYVADKVITMAMPGDPPSTSPTSPSSAKRISKNSGGSNPDTKTQALGVNVEDVIAEGPGLSAKGWDAFADLRDAIAPGEKIGWWIVYNGDPERSYEDLSDVDEEDYDDDEEEEAEEETIDEPAQEIVAPASERPPDTHQKAAALENIKKKQPIPIPLRTRPKTPKTTPLEEQKSPLRETSKGSAVLGSSSPQVSNKKLPPIPPPKPGKPPQRPTTPAKPDSLKKKLFGSRKS